MQEFREIGNVAGVAVRKTQEQKEIEQSKARMWGPEKMGGQRFTDPAANIRAMGIQPGMKIGDFGAGSGAYALAAARTVGPSGRVYAVDVQKDLLVRIKNNAMEEKLDWVDIVWGNFEAIGGSSIASGSLDVAIMSNVLFQLEQPSTALAEARRTIKPGGKLVIIDWADSFNGMGPQPQHVMTKEKTLELASAAGFVLAREFPAGTHHYGIVFQATGAPK